MRKLVRDRIPELSGKRAERVIGNVHKSYLRKKVIEEEKELWNASFQATSFPQEEVFRNAVKEEAADVITVVMALCNAHGLCWEEIEEDRAGNDVFYVKDGKPEGLAIELADVVIRICSFCQERGIDLPSAIKAKMVFNRTRPFKHGGKKY